MSKIAIEKCDNRASYFLPMKISVAERKDLRLTGDSAGAMKQTENVTSVLKSHKAIMLVTV